MPRIYSKGVWQHQADATLTQANPVSGTKYTLLDTTLWVRLKSIALSVTWTVQPDPLELHITIDGQSYTGTVNNPVSTTWYLWAWRSYSGIIIPVTTDSMSGYGSPFLCEARSVKLEAETTGGTVSLLSGRCKYERMP